MVGNRQRTNTFGKEKNTVKKLKKISKGHDVVTNAHRVRMKGVVIIEKDDGLAGGSSSL